MEIPADVAARLLAEAPLARLATLDPHGAPVQVPIVYVQIEDEIWSPVDGKPKRGSELARVRNLRADPRASLLIDGYHPDWRRLWWIRIAAHGRIVSARQADARPGQDALRAKYPQYQETPLTDASDSLLVLRVQHVRTWAASPAAWATLGAP